MHCKTIELLPKLILICAVILMLWLISETAFHFCAFCPGSISRFNVEGHSSFQERWFSIIYCRWFVYFSGGITFLTKLYNKSLTTCLHLFISIYKKVSPSYNDSYRSGKVVNDFTHSWEIAIWSPKNFIKKFILKAKNESWGTQ